MLTKKWIFAVASLAALAGCDAISTVAQLKTATLTATLGDEEFSASKPLHSADFQMTNRECVALDPKVTATLNGTTLPAITLGGYHASEAFESCSGPEWRGDLTALDGGSLTFVLTDSTGTVTATFAGGAETHLVTPHDSLLQGGGSASFDWLPATDDITGVSAEFINDAGARWGVVTFQPPEPQTGVGRVLVNAVKSAVPSVQALIVWAITSLLALTVVLIPVAGPVLVLPAQVAVAAGFLAHGAVAESRGRLGLPRWLYLRELACLLGLTVGFVPYVLFPPLMLVGGGAMSISGALVAIGTKYRRDALDARAAATG